MQNINIDKYPKTKELLENADLLDVRENINWTLLSKQDAAVALAKLYIISLMGQSKNIVLRERAMQLTDEFYLEIGDNIHVYAKEEAREQLNLKPDDIVRIFSRVELGGHIYNKQNSLL